MYKLTIRSLQHPRTKQPEPGDDDRPVLKHQLWVVLPPLARQRDLPIITKP
jgi:hypothetical protein